MPKETNSVANEQEAFEKTVLIAHKEKDNLVICEVCGYANPEKTAICKMCSNYLKGVL
jgi:ribosomal protein L40E